MSFEDNRDACESALKRITSAIPRINQKASADDIKQANGEATRFLREAEGLIRKLETEAKTSAPSIRRNQLDIIATLKGTLTKARADLQKSNDNAARGELLGKSDTKKKMDMEAVDKLGAAADKASAGTEKLQQASQVLSETQDIGIGVIDTMQQQRESLLRSTTKVSSTNSLTDQARGIMRMMQARAITNKALLFFVVLVLLSMIGVVIYFGWVKDPKS